MSKNKPSPLEVVERYHAKYLEYEAAFNKAPFSEKERQEEVVNIAKSDIDLDSKEFEEKMIEAMIDKTYKIADVNNSAAKFAMFVDFYLLTQEKELPKNILNDYNTLPIKESIKTHFSIKDGEFIRNEKLVINEDTKAHFKLLIQQIKNQI